jgi:rare lipoprotein A
MTFLAKRPHQAVLWTALASVLAGCSTVPNEESAPAPLAVQVDSEAVGDEPVPQFEQPSRSGNPDTYVVFGRRYRVKETSAGYRETGVASWYGWEFHGRKTSSGPLFNMFELTAAHKTLPLPTYARVTNLENGRSIVVKVTDRGPFVGERVLDLSYAAAARLDMLETGTARVEIEALAPYQSLPELAARRAAAREQIASRAPAPTLHFAREAPARPAASLATVALAAANARARSGGELSRLAKISPLVIARSPDKIAAVTRTAPPAKGRDTAAVAARTTPTAKGRETVAVRDVPAAKGRDTAAKTRESTAARTPVASKNSALYLVGTVSERNGAQRAQGQLSSQLRRDVRIESATGRQYEVRVPLRNPGEARQVAVRLASLGISRSRIVAD